LNYFSNSKDENEIDFKLFKKQLKEEICEMKEKETKNFEAGKNNLKKVKDVESFIYAIIDNNPENG
jgi:hypothetical protein